jgi:hypothetical protein
MMVVSTDVAYCYNRVSHVIMSLDWLALTGNAPAIVATLICLQTMKFFNGLVLGTQKPFLAASFTHLT